jgi:uncharacterized protein (TIGR01777 family)
MRILLAGASGLIGSEIVRRATAEHEVRRLVRRAVSGEDEYTWNPIAGHLPAEAIEWADAVISLSGASLARLPWTRRYRDLLRRSRLSTTGTIARAIAVAETPPTAWVCGSAVGYYGDRPGETLTEESRRGRGYLADLVDAWEQATTPARDRTRVVHARTGLVLARGGALKPLMLATRLGLGATVGGGEQMWPWIGLADEARALLHLATASTRSGPVNLVGPEPASSRRITTELALSMRRPYLLRLREFALKAGLGLAADELLLADQHVEPRALLDDGFTFIAPSAEKAVATAVRRG